MSEPIRPAKNTREVHDLRLKVRVHGRHPWFYRKMIRRPETTIPAGSSVRVSDRDGKFVGTGFYNPRTDLALRMLARRDVADVDALLAERLREAIRWRSEGLGLTEVTNGYRLVHSEGDGFPGLIIDRLGDAVVAQVFSLCMMQRIESIGEALSDALAETMPNLRLVLVDDERAREHEGFERPPRSAPFSTEVLEHGVRYAVRPGQDHKTGFFADQREARAWTRRFARGRRVLDLCCNSGGFALNAALGEAREVVGVDLDEAMVEQATRNAKRNGVADRVRFEHGDAFDFLRDVKAGIFDLIVLDPPKWIFGKDRVEQGSQRYRDLNELALRKIAGGGILVTSSCSGALSEARFLGIVTDAAAAAGRDAQTIHIGGAGPDHPVALECPQTRYLKTCVLRIGAASPRGAR